MEAQPIALNGSRTRKVLTFVFLLVILEGTPAFCEESTGPYITGALGWARWHGDYPTGCIYNESLALPSATYGFSAYACTNSLVTRDTLSGRIGGGWRIDPRIAFELGYSNFGRASITREVGSTGHLPDGGFTIPIDIPETGRYRLQGIDISALGAVPLSTNVSLTGRLGALAYYESYSESGIGPHQFSHEWSASTSGVAPLIGVGVAYQVNPELSVHTEWNRIQRVGKVFTGFSGLGGSAGGGRFDLNVLWIAAEYALH